NDGRVAGNIVVWDVGPLPPNEVRMLRLVTTAAAPAAKVVNTATVSGQAVNDPVRPGDASGAPLGLVQAKADAILSVQGVTALGLKVSDRRDPIQAGEPTTYDVQVTNKGSLDSERVSITCDIPPEMRVTAVYGPGNYRLINS